MLQIDYKKWEIGNPIDMKLHTFDVAHEERGVYLVAEAGDVAMGMAAQDEGYVTKGKAAGGIWKGLLHEGVVAKIGVGIGDDREIDHDRQTKLVRQVNGEINRGVVMGALGALHPVDDASACGSIGAGAADGDALFV